MSSLRGRRGQSMVELALILPTLILMTLGMVDYGRAYYFQVAITNAAREGARTGIVNIYLGPRVPTCTTSPYAFCPVQTDDNIRQAVQSELSGTGIVVPASNVRICPPYSIVDPACPSNETRVGDYNNAVKTYDITVKVSYQFQLYTPLLQNLVGNPLTINPGVSMRTDY